MTDTLNSHVTLPSAEAPCGDEDRTAKERPILFSAPMVRALLAGTKTQTRRAAKFKADPGLNLKFTGLSVSRFGESWCLLSRGAGAAWEERSKPLRSPYGIEGERLWAREAWADLSVTTRGDYTGIAYRADDYDEYGNEDEPITREMIRWKPSIHMPRALSRILLEVTDVRVERLQSISEADALAEGCVMRPARHCYEALWESINGPGSWSANPWVWAVSFRRLTA